MFASYAFAPAGYPQPPFAGPPPQPSHIRANPQDWKNGAWAINPAFKSSSGWAPAPGATSVWMPGQAWGMGRRQAADWQAQQQQMAAAANYNPYKRVPRPPSAEYLATKLVDNPLGLTNMIPRRVCKLLAPIHQDGLAAPTPWVWNPRNLDDSPDEGDSPLEQPQSESVSATAPAASSIYSRPHQLRENTDPTPQHHRPHVSTTPVRHSSEPPADRRSSTDNTPERPRAFAHPQRHANGEKGFAASRDLQPTFSTNIVRTPDHYNKAGRSSTMAASPPPQPIYGPPANQRRSSVDADLSSRMERLSTTTPTRTNALSRHSSLPASFNTQAVSTSMTGVASFVEEPSTLLSPLMGIQHKQQQAQTNALRPLGPSSSLNTIPEGFDSDASRRSLSPKHKSKRRSRHASPNPPESSPPMTNVFGMPNGFQAARVSPPEQQQQSVTPPYPATQHNLTPPHNPNGLTPPHSAPLSNITPPRIHHQQHTAFSTPPNSASASTTSYPITSPLHHNPLPAPPKEPLSRDPSLRIPQQRPMPLNYRRRVRKGWWNRRGDHLTMDGYIVYAPASAAYPEELRDYPDGTAGYRDQTGRDLPWVERPELPESLPRHGQAPLQPYEKFVVYEYLQ
ncbi:hypothetical protein MKEN_00036500 [Mycena kentingensis (nom. inval.)]|nr:hypothetical protein MKEN_00036500 [Mycena kentingensis (nom. inval.)]